MTETLKTTPHSGKTKPIVFFGTEEFSATALTSLIEAGFLISAVITKPDTKRGRGQRLIEPTVKTIAKRHNIDVWQPINLNEVIEPIRRLQPATGVLVSFGRIIPEDILSLFTPGIVNVHPSLLPKYRGPSPIETALLSGDETTGVTIMKLVSAMDAGGIYTQKVYPETILQASQTELYESLSMFGSKILVDTLPSIMSGTLLPVDQDHSQATYCRLIKKSDGNIDWRKPAEQIERDIRAYKGWPGSRTTLQGVECIVTDASILNQTAEEEPGTITTTDTTLTVATSDKLLAINRIKPVGKKEMSVREFLNGYGHLLS